VSAVLYSCETWALIKGGTQAKGIYKKKPEAYVWAKEG